MRKYTPEELYYYWYPLPDPDEYVFFEQLLANSKSALELGCGTGRLLLPLLADGHVVEGIDHSSDMLALCRKKAAESNLEPQLYHQRIQDMQLPQQYDLIFSALDTFGYIADHDNACRALQMIYAHLNAGGMFAVQLSLPWLYAPESASEWREVNITIIDNEQYTLYEKSIHDPIEQLFYHSYRAQKDQTIISEFETIIRWYSRYEFSAMLKSVGFKKIAVRTGYTGEGPQDSMIFTAQK